MLGAAEGVRPGVLVGTRLGVLGVLVGIRLGTSDGIMKGTGEGARLGAFVGVGLGAFVGDRDGIPLTVTIGLSPEGSSIVPFGSLELSS